MVTKEALENTLKKIEASSHFGNETDFKLLKYLVSAEFEGRSVKEADIARDVFDRGEDFNPMEDSIVRSHMYSLRKKLRMFNLTEGSDEEIQIVLPKGHYKVNFIPKSSQKKTTRRKNFIIGLTGVLVFLFAVLSIFLYLDNIELRNKIDPGNITEVENPIWQDYIDSELPTLLVLGNYYIFKEVSTNGSSRLIRDTKINSEKDFLKYLNENPEERSKIIDASVSYLGVEVPYVVSYLTRQFIGVPGKLKFKLSSELTWQDIQQNNIIFVGSIKTLRKLDYFFQSLRFKYSLFPHTIYYTPNMEDTVDTIVLESDRRGRFFDDYSIVAKFPGSHNNNIMLISSFSSFGKTEPIKKLVASSLKDDLQKNQLIDDDIPQYFEMLFRVEGIERSGFETEILYFHEIVPKNFGIEDSPSDTTIVNE